MSKPYNHNLKASTILQGTTKSDLTTNNPDSRNQNSRGSNQSKEDKLIKNNNTVGKSHRPHVAGKTLPSSVNSKSNFEKSRDKTGSRAAANANLAPTHGVSTNLSSLNSQLPSSTATQIEQYEPSRTANFTHVGQLNKEDRSSSDLLSRIPATKFSISPAAARVFANPKSLADEIIRHKKISKRFIKKANLYGNTVIIATDDLDTKRVLEEEWPPEAFLHGIKFQKKDLNLNDKPIRMIIFAKQASIDLDCVETREQLLAQGITEAKHLTSRIKDKGNTGIIRATIANKEKAETLIRNKVKIGFSVFKAQYDVKV